MRLAKTIAKGFALFPVGSIKILNGVGLLLGEAMVQLRDLPVGSKFTFVEDFEPCLTYIVVGEVVNPPGFWLADYRHIKCVDTGSIHDGLGISEVAIVAE
jgi:hypothetical protein